MPTFTKARAGSLLLLIALTLPLFAGCDSNGGSSGLNTEVTVMTRNVYLGADLFSLLDPSCADAAILVCVAQLYGTVVASDVHARMAAIAAEIEATNPDLVGLQEVTTYYSQVPGDHHIPGSETQATNVTFDFLEILMDELDARGLNYNIAAENMNADVEFPSTVDGVNFIDYRLMDRDVILARNDVTVSNVLENNFDAAITAVIPIGGVDITFTRGFSHLTAMKDGVSFTFANAHLEVGGEAVGAQILQGAVLKGALSNLTSPVIAVGDFNSDPSDPGDDGSVYRNFLDDYTDAWANSQGTSTPGNTCCQDDLHATPSQLDSRIDIIFYRGDADATSTDVVGENEADMTGSGVWPSDHAGVVATITVRN